MSTTRLIPVSNSDQQLLSRWFENDEVGKKELSSYKNINSWLKLLNPETRFGWIVYEQNQPVGFTDLEITPAHVGYFSFYVAPLERGKGKSKKLLYALISEAKKLHVQQLEAHAEENNIASQKAVASVGFVQEGRDKDNYLIYKLIL